AIVQSLVANPSDVPVVDLDVDTESDDVARLQTALEKLGYIDRVTGYYGPMTSDAVSTFQQDNGIEPTGAYGPVARMPLASRLPGVGRLARREGRKSRDGGFRVGRKLVHVCDRGRHDLVDLGLCIRGERDLDVGRARRLGRLKTFAAEGQCSDIVERLSQARAQLRVGGVDRVVELRAIGAVDVGAVQLRELLLIVLERVTELLVRIVPCRDDRRLRGSLSGDGLDCGGDGRPNVIVRRGDASAHRGGRDNGGG